MNESKAISRTRFKLFIPQEKKNNEKKSFSFGNVYFNEGKEDLRLNINNSKKTDFLLLIHEVNI